MKKSKIYTLTGDEGKTSLVNGRRISKGDEKIDLYGSVDELNSSIGMAISLMREGEEEVRDHDLNETINTMTQIQSRLFDLGASLACDKQARSKFQLEEVPKDITAILEKKIDEMDATLPLLKNFILPGGSLTASQLHICRTMARKVERKMVDYSEKEELPLNSLAFINRLSDYFFVLARYTNLKQGQREITWSRHCRRTTWS